MPILSICQKSLNGNGKSFLKIDGFSTFLKKIITSIVPPTSRLKVVANATPVTPRTGIPNQPRTNVRSRTVFIIFITIVIYIGIRV